MNDFRHCYIVCSAAHCDGNVKTARTHSEHTDASCRRGVTVRADERFSGDAEAFEMNLMADTVSGAGKAYAVLFGHRLNISVVVCVFKARLKGVMVYICNRKLGSDSLRAHSFKLKIRHRTGCVLRQRLVYFKSYLRADCHLA